MRRLSALSLAACAALLLAASPAAAQKVTIKLGTMAPDGSSWHNLLKEMGQKWTEASGGVVKVKIYPGGVAGNEGDMVRKLRVGQMQAAALSVVGLHDIETAPQAIAVPGVLEEDEFEHVFEALTPVYDERFLAKGFVPVMWGDTGSVHIFTNKQVTPAQMKGLKMFAWAGDSASIKALELAGFQPVVISSTDILPSLATGMIDSFATSPVMAFTARWYERAPYMSSSAWGHLPGATIVTKEAWEKIPAEARPKLLAIAKEYGKKVNAEVLKLQADAIQQMKKNGLKVVPYTDADRKTWNEMAERTWKAARGGIVSEADFDLVIKARDEYRASKGKK